MSFYVKTAGEPINRIQLMRSLEDSLKIVISVLFFFKIYPRAEWYVYVTMNELDMTQLLISIKIDKLLFHVHVFTLMWYAMQTQNLWLLKDLSGECTLILFP